jgi:hypothetical protein
MKKVVTVIATWKREILQRIFGPRKVNDAEWMMMMMMIITTTTCSKWVLLQRLDPEDKVVWAR